MKVQLYTAAILFACAKCEGEIALQRASQDAAEKQRLSAWPKWLSWFKPQFIPSKAFNRQLAIAGRLTAIAKHHKASSMLLVEDEYLDAIALFLAPSEAYADGDISGRI